ncbi:enoyl-CoA hydratase/isomerase family protein [Nocardioides marmoribigeumensis]|uniref:Enoyl-CoA hydratase/carnithine racemase n=1 Tax=Nocardioides marmoribigeumensis TaxID=433649 RepID=A0ABU2C1E3_9ACTN|nr:enoyl-CoA hydratase/isomerase family protein [Nocardioides marmoribigeumensis]MDR7364465.1 enoyl-CoA hydratase/carnithine racemase [Nocardioides marmoribigeumensis]
MNPEILEAGGVRVDVADGVATVTLDRPDRRNAQTPSMWAALAHVGDSLPDDVRVVVLRGEGQSFSAGLDRRLIDGSGIEGEDDIPGLMSQSDDAIVDWVDVCQHGFTWLRDPRFISIAVVHGHAYGAGFQLALSCDYRIATPEAAFCMKESALGLVPDLTGTKPLVEAVGYSRALDLCATARVVGGEEAAAIGLVNVLTSAESLEDEVAAAVARFCGPPHGAVAATKQIVLAASENDLDSQRLLERRTQVGRLRDLARQLSGQA